MITSFFDNLPFQTQQMKKSTKVRKHILAVLEEFHEVIKYMESINDIDEILLYDAYCDVLAAEVNQYMTRPLFLSKFWYRPHCMCPKMDNDDAFPSNYYVFNQSCLLHGVDHES